MEIYPFWIVSSIHNRWISVVVLAVVGNLPQIPKRAKYQRCISTLSTERACTRCVDFNLRADNPRRFRRVEDAEVQHVT